MRLYKGHELARRLTELGWLIAEYYRTHSITEAEMQNKIEIPLIRVKGGWAECTLCPLYNAWDERCERPEGLPCPKVVVADDDGEYIV